MLEKLISVRGDVRAKECAIYERSLDRAGQKLEQKEKTIVNQKFHRTNQYDQCDIRPF